MPLSNKKIGDTISMRSDLGDMGSNSDGYIKLSEFSTKSQNSKLFKSTNSTACDRTFLKENDNSINQQAQVDNDSVSLSALHGLRNKVWCGFVPEQDADTGPGNKFWGDHVRCIDIPPGVTSGNAFLVGGGGGCGSSDARGWGGNGGSGSVVNTIVDLTAYGNVDKQRRVILVAGAGGYYGSTGSGNCGLPGSGHAMIDGDPGAGWGNMRDVAVTFPYSHQTTTRINQHGWSRTACAEFNIMLYLYGNYAKQDSYTLRVRADDACWIYDVTSANGVSSANTLGNDQLITSVGNAEPNGTVWNTGLSSSNTNAVIKVLRVQLSNTGGGPTHLSIRMYDKSGNEVWNTRKRDGIGALNWFHQGGRGGMSGPKGTSGGGGAGGSASFVAIESPADSGNVKIMAFAGGGGGGAGYGNNSTWLYPTSMHAKPNYHWNPLYNHDMLYNQPTALAQVSPWDANYGRTHINYKYDNGTVRIESAGNAGDDHGGCGGGGGPFGECGGYYIKYNHLGAALPSNVIESIPTGGYSGQSGTTAKGMVGDRVKIPGSSAHPAYYPSVVNSHTAVNNIYKFSVADVLHYTDNSNQLWNGQGLEGVYKNTPGAGGTANTAYLNGNNGFAYFDFAASPQVSSNNKDWWIYEDGYRSNLVHATKVNGTGTLQIHMWFGSNDNTSDANKYKFELKQIDPPGVTDNPRISITKPDAYNQHYMLEASSPTFPNLVSGLVRLTATYNGVEKTFDFAYVFEWVMVTGGNAGQTYTIPGNIPVEERRPDGA